MRTGSEYESSARSFFFPDLIPDGKVLGSELHRKGNPSVEVVIPKERTIFGFEKLSGELVNPPAHSISAFESARYTVDWFRRKSRMAQVFLGTLGFSPEEYYKKHILDHLRKPELFIAIGCPYYDLQLALNIAYHTERVIMSPEFTKESHQYQRARMKQQKRWVDRMYGSVKQVGILDSCIQTVDRVSELLTTRQSFSAFPTYNQAQDIKNGSLDSARLVAFNLSYFQNQDNSVLNSKVSNESTGALHQMLTEGIQLPGDVLVDPAAPIPDLPELQSSLNLFKLYCERIKSLLDSEEEKTLMPLGNWQTLFDEVHAEYVESTS